MNKETYDKFLLHYREVPEGLAYDKKIRAFRTQTPNLLIAQIGRLAGDSALITKGLTPF